MAGHRLVRTGRAYDRSPIPTALAKRNPAPGVAATTPRGVSPYLLQMATNNITETFTGSCSTAHPGEASFVLGCWLVVRTYLYGPAVCCKPDVSDGGIGLALLYPARE